MNERAMNKKIFPSFGQAAGFILLLFPAAFAGLPGFLPYLIWENDYTYQLGNISAYLAAFIITSRYAIKAIKKTGDAFSLPALFRKKMSFLMMVCLSIITFSVSICTDFLIELIHLPDLYSAEVSKLFQISWLGFISLVILPAFFEETLLRGIILEQFLKRYSSAAAILLSALLFGLMHINPSQVLGGFIGGCFLGWVYTRTGNLKYCILIHFVNNGIAWVELKLNSNFQQSAITLFLNHLQTSLPAFLIAAFVCLIGVFMIGRMMHKRHYQSAFPW